MKAYFYCSMASCLMLTTFLSYSCARGLLAISTVNTRPVYAHTKKVTGEAYRDLLELISFLENSGALHHIVSKYKDPKYVMPRSTQQTFSSLVDPTNPAYTDIRKIVLSRVES